MAGGKHRRLIVTANKDLIDNLALMRGPGEYSRRYKMLALKGDEIEARISQLEARKKRLKMIYKRR